MGLSLKCKLIRRGSQLKKQSVCRCTRGVCAWMCVSVRSAAQLVQARERRRVCPTVLLHEFMWRCIRK